jgi:PAS domain S-box-containing protein
MGDEHQKSRRLDPASGDKADSAGQAALDQLLAELGMHRTELEIQNEELRRIQGDLERARDGYQDLFETAPVGYFLLGARAQILGANLAAAQLLGVPRDELIGRPFPAFIDPIEAYRFHIHHQQVFQHVGTKHRLELRVRRRDSSFAEALIEATCMQGSDQRLCRMAIIDVTEQRQAERRLAERQNHLAAILNTVIDAVVTIDECGIIESVNTGAIHMFGYTEEELVGHPIALLMPEPHRARYRFLLKRFSTTVTRVSSAARARCRRCDATARSSRRS